MKAAFTSSLSMSTPGKRVFPSSRSTLNGSIDSTSLWDPSSSTSSPLSSSSSSASPRPPESSQESSGGVLGGVLSHRPKLFFKRKNVSRCGKRKLRRRSGRPRGSHRPKLFFKKKSFRAVVCHVFDYSAGLINTGNIHVLKWAFESGCPVILSGDFIW